MVEYLKSGGFPVESLEGDVTNLCGAVAAHERPMTNENSPDFLGLTDDQLREN